MIKYISGLWLVVFMLFTATPLFAQNTTVIENSANNYLIKGLSNPIYIGFTEEEEYLVEVDNGVCQKRGNNKYTIIPENIGTLIITITNSKGIVIEQRPLAVIDIPIKAHVVGLVDKFGDLDLRKARKLDIKLEHPSLHLDFAVTSWGYELLVIENDKVTDRFVCQRKLFDEEIKNRLSDLKQEAIVIVKDIEVGFQNNKVIQLEDLIYQIK